MNTLDDILAKHNWPTNTTSDNIEIGGIEAKIEFELPSDYKYFISRYSGHETEIGQQFLTLWDKKNLIALNEDYKINEHLPGTIGIGSNGAGELIGIEKIENGEFRIILTPSIDLNREYHIEIGNSFTDFLVRMYKGEEWFRKTK